MKPLLFFIAILTALPSSVHARPQEVSPLPANELAAQVGGLRTPNGIEFSFGAVVDTYVDGSLVLRSQLTYTEAGAQTVTQTFGDGTAGLGTGGANLRLPGSHGETVIFHDLGDGHIGSVVLNTADGRDIRQDTAVNLTLPGLQGLQADVKGQIVSANLQDSVQRALANSAK